MSGKTQELSTLDAYGTIRILGSALFDAWFLVDDHDRILDFNPAFHALFPRSIARNLKLRKYGEVLKLTTDESCSLRDKCIAEGGRIRLDEIGCEIGDETLQLSISAIGVTLPGDVLGTLVLLRNVTGRGACSVAISADGGGCRARTTRSRG